jgi:5'-nucleotidase
MRQTKLRNFSVKNTMRILLVNDDGIHADGLHALWRALNADGHEVFVCVPDRQRSACGHGITMHEPLRAKEVKTPDGIAWACSGLPADCVPLAILQLMKAPPEVVISGINLGPNLGDDVHYSGTVAGAMEGLLNGIPSMAISLADYETPQWDGAAQFAARFVPQMAQLELPLDTFINVNVPNVPPEEIRGVKITRQGSRRYKGDIVRYEAPHIGVYYWRGGEVIDRPDSGETDIWAVKNNFIAVTPLHVDLSNVAAHEALKKLF